MKKPVFILFLSLITGLFFEISTSFAGDTANRLSPIMDISNAPPIVLAQAEVLPEKAADNEDALDQDLMDDYKDQAQLVADPLYYFNYAMYSFNDVLYFYALKPVAQGYKFIMPTFLRQGVSNIFENLMFPVRFVNTILQGKLVSASDEIGIFLVNSTVGILGFNQVAQKHLNMKISDEDLGQTLGTYAIGNGFYLVLPVLGPATLRDAVGRAGDIFITPLTYVDPWELNLGLSALDTINKTSFRIGDYEALKAASLDPYAAIRNAYIQNRKSKIQK